MMLICDYFLQHIVVTVAAVAIFVEKNAVVVDLSVDYILCDIFEHLSQIWEILWYLDLN